MVWELLNIEQFCQRKVHKTKIKYFFVLGPLIGKAPKKLDFNGGNFLKFQTKVVREIKFYILIHLSVLMLRS
jgi:hypothetical protein